MDFEDTPEEAQFRAGVRAFLDGNAKRRTPGAGMVYRAGNEHPEFRERAKAWQAKKADAGYAGITWPKEWGGQGGTAIQQVIFDQEEAKYDVPRGLFDIGLGMCIPTICTWGTQEHRDRFARAGATRRGGLVPALLRARRRLRSRGAAHARGAGRG